MRYYSLNHHGIKGQHWGVRRGPPYPIEDRVLRKGTRLSSVSLLSNSKAYRKSKRWMYTYNPDDDWDSKVYKGDFAARKTNYGQQHIYEHRYEVVSDLKMPTKKERIDAFIDLYKKMPIQTSNDLDIARQLMRESDFGSKEAQNLNVWKLKTPEDYKKAYEIFSHAMNYMHMLSSTKKYAEMMSTKYDAMVDDTDQETYYGVHDPIVVFKAKTALKEIGKARMIDLDEMCDNYNEVGEELVRRGLVEWDE